MKSNFALSLSFDGLRLMHRVSGGWHMVGEVALDDADVTGALARLRAAADTLEPNGIATKLLIPNDQIKYIAIDGTRATDETVRDALHGATPYNVDELAYDFAKGGGRTYVAAVAKDTLTEAQQFAAEHGFNPVSFAAVPEPFTYIGEAFFGATSGKTAQRDDEPVIVIGVADVDLPTVEAVVEAQDAPAEIVEPEPVATAPEEPTTVEPEVVEPEAVEPAPVEPEPVEPSEIEPEHVEPEPVEIEPVAADPQPDPTDDVEPVEAPSQDTPQPTPDAKADPVPDTPSPADAAPVFASRLRAVRNEGRPEAPAPDDKPAVAVKREEPTLRRPPPSTLAVPTGKGTDAMPPLSAPNRDAVDSPAPLPITTDAPDPDVAPAITGQAPTALPADVAVAAASLTVDPDPVDPETKDSQTRGASATALGAASAVGGAVGGMFASRRMARADAKADAADADTPDARDEKSRLTVFGARKKLKPKPVVGGKPRFLGLILTAVLLLFLLAFAAFAAVAALSEDGFAAWFGFAPAETQIAATPVDPDLAASGVAAVQPSEPPVAVTAPDALASPTAPTGGQVLSPEEAARIYAATGVWQRAPRIPQIPRTTSLDAMTLGTAPRPVVRVPASPLASASSVAGDAVIATPIDPPAPDTTFNFDADGLVVATPQGAVTPDGNLIIAGPPPLNPPTRPGTVAPVVTPQEQLAAVVPDTAETLDDAPEGVIVIAGRPAIEPPVRTGTAVPAPTPATEALASGEAPLVATDGLLVLAGSPPVLPPIRPGTVATPPVVAVPTPDIPTLETPVIDAPVVDPSTPDTLPEGLNVIAGPPPVLPPVRPGTLAPQNDAVVESLTDDITTALATGTAQTPSVETRRPLLRPAGVIQAASAVANAPVLGALTPTEAASFRPSTRPASLAPQPDPEIAPEPIVEQAAVAIVETPRLQIAPEIAAAVQAAANRPNPIVNPTAQAVPVSSRPDPRPRNMDRIVARANDAQTRAATQVAAVAPRTVAPSGPTGSAVAQNATLDNAINLRAVNLIGIYGGSGDRRALVRLGNGRYVRVTVGDRLDGGRVSAISAAALRYTKRGREITLQVAG